VGWEGKGEVYNKILKSQGNRKRRKEGEKEEIFE